MDKRRRIIHQDKIFKVKQEEKKTNATAKLDVNTLNSILINKFFFPLSTQTDKLC